jgi:hypothetical protein
MVLRRKAGSRGMHEERSEEKSRKGGCRWLSTATIYARSAISLSNFLVCSLWLEFLLYIYLKH